MSPSLGSCPPAPPLPCLWEVGSWGTGQTGLLLLSPRLTSELWRVGKKDREKEKEKGERARGLTSSLWELPGKEMGGSGSHRRDPSPADAAAEGRQGCTALVEECPRGPGSSGGGEEEGEPAQRGGGGGREERGGEGGGEPGGGEAQQQGRQRLHTRLYPVEISRALKSSESMLPVCFCSRAQGQQRRPGPE